MKKKVWVNPNKMLFESPHKAFNKQCTLISTGNQIGNVVYSNYIRPYCELECNGFTHPPGYLQNYDLSKNIVGMVPQHIANTVKELGREMSLILYNFHHWRDGKRIEDGWVLTTEDDNSYRLLRTWYINRDWRARAALDEAVKYITN